MIQANHLRHGVNGFDIDVSLDVPDGEYFVLLGATGSGKTLLLECLCGLRPIQSGTLIINEEDLTAAEPAERGIGYVPQDGALFNHLTVRRNIEFGLRVRRQPPGERSATAVYLAAALGIDHLLDRHIPGLSGGERQRVALARALVCEPSVLLLDEPVSALDEFTRDAICRELRKLHRRRHISTVHVCHSFEEARQVADRIGVIERGRIIQTGSPDELMTRPASPYVANILRLENVFTGTARRAAGGSTIEVGKLSLAAPRGEGPVEFFVRPWDVRIVDGGAQRAGVNVLPGRIVEFSLAGPSARLRIDGRLPLVIVVSREQATAAGLAEGVEIHAAFGPDAVHVFQA